MPKNIILCSDGTGNSAIKGRGTNVFKLFEGVDLHGHQVDARLDPQLAFYDDGVGSGRNPLLRAAGGAAGYGLKRNVKDLYRQLSRVYDPGDRIFLFGFSRGAFTVRTLAGLIGACGVLKGEEFETARALVEAVGDAYDAYRASYDSLLTRAIGRVRRSPDRAEAVKRLHRAHPVHMPVPIAFIGVWDSVDAVGMPFALADVINRMVYQFKFPTKELGPHVARACHALSIDDQRAAFEPVLWKGPDARIEQVWFSGVHSNVGGGYPKQGMSLVALDWMLAHAANHGLRLQKADCELFRGHASVDDHLYDSRAGLGLFYRWAPRDIRRFCDKSGIDPRIHISVTERIAHGTDDYAPGNIPRTATVVTTPVDRGDAERASKEYLLHRRADAVETVIRRALHEHDLLEEVRTPVAIGSASYWCFIVAWIFLAIAIVGVLSGGFQQPWSRWAWAIAGAGLAFVSARILAGLADGAMSDAFSQFWQENQKRLRAALKQARKEAEGGSLMGRRRLR